MIKRILSLFLVVGLVISVTGCNTKEDVKTVNNDIKIILYKTGTEEIIKEVNITDDDDITQLNEYLSSIEPLKEEDSVNRVLAREVSVVYSDDISVGIQLSEKEYCYYINKEKDISTLAKIPSGMHDFVSKYVESS